MKIYIFIFINQYVDGYLDSFHVLAIVNGAAVNIRIHASFQIRGYLLRVYTQEWDYWIMWYL